MGEDGIQTFGQIMRFLPSRVYSVSAYLADVVHAHRANPLGKGQGELLLLQPGLAGLCHQQQAGNIHPLLEQVQDYRVLLHQLQSHPAEVRQT